MVFEERKGTAGGSLTVGGLEEGRAGGAAVRARRRNVARSRH